MSVDNVENALLAINRVLVVARAMSYERRSHEDLANVLDVAELLPMLIVRNVDQTSVFRGLLSSLVRLDYRFASAVDIYKG